jgi:hypothetical protein
MTEYIERGLAVCIANYAIDEHPYDKDPEKPETFSDYNRGWNDACDCIQERLEDASAAKVIPFKLLEAAPKIDAVRVVRCKDCEYSYESIGYIICSHGVCCECIVQPDFYCAEGKRRNENDDQ